MPLTPALPEELEAGQRLLRAEIRVPRTEARNVAIAAEHNADTYLSFKGRLYKIPPLDYKLGVQLQEIQLMIESLVKAEKETDDLATLTDEDKARHLTALLACYEQAVDLFWKACTPLAWWHRRRHKKQNPFVDCTSQEIGELLGFFYMCRMKSRVDILGSLASRQSLSTLTQRTI